MQAQTSSTASLLAHVRMRSQPQLGQHGLAQISNSTSTISREATQHKGTADTHALINTVRSAFKSIPLLANASLSAWRFAKPQGSWKAEVSQLFTPSRRKRKRGEAVDSPQHVSVKDEEASPGSVKRLKVTGASPRTRRNSRNGPLNSAPTQRHDVVVFGCGEDGELGLGSIKYEKKNPAVADKPRINHLLRAEDVGVVQVAVGGRHCAALTHDGQVLTWGVNDSRALGRDTRCEHWKHTDRDTTDSNPLESSPMPAEGLSRSGLSIAQVAATDNATFALTDAGFVYGWGTFHASDGVYGFLREKMQKRKTPKYDSRFQVAPVRIEGLRNIKELSAGMNHVLALTESGDVYAWGSGQQAQLGRRLVQRHQYESLTPRMVDLPKKGIAKIFAGFNHSFALDRRGQVWTWGLNNFGQTGIPANDENLHIGNPTLVQGLKGYAILHIAGGFHHSLACTEEGQVLAWGRCDGSQMGISTSTIPNDKFLFDSRGRPRILLNPTIIPGITATFVAAGIDNSLAIDTNGTVSSWGFSENFRTGLGTQKTVHVPTELVGKGVANKAFTFAGCGGQFTVMTRPHV